MGDILLRCHGKIVHPVYGCKGRNKGHPLHVHHRLDAELSKLDAHLLKGTCDAIGKGLLQQGQIEDPPLFPKAQDGDSLFYVEQAEKAADRLAHDRRYGASGDTPLEPQNEKQVQHHIQEGAEHKEVKGSPAVPQGPQGIGKEIIDKGKYETAVNDPQVCIRRLQDILRHLQEPKQGTGYQKEQQTYNRGKNKAADHGGADLSFQTAVALCPVLGTGKDPGSHAHSADKEDHQVHHRPCTSHCSQGIISQEFPHDHGICRIIGQLKEIPQHQGDRKGRKLRDDGPLRHIFCHRSLHLLSFLCFH